MWKENVGIYEKFKDLLKLGLLRIQFTIDCLFLLLYSVICAYPLHIITSFIPFRWKSFKEEKILVTGSASGIGRQICLRIAKIEKCCTIICWDINDKGNNSLVEELRTLGVKKVVAYKIDVSDYSQVKEGADKVKKEFGGVSLLINNAGAGETAAIPLWKHTETEINQLIDINLKSHFWMLKEFLPNMIIRNKGHVVTINSILGQVHSKNASVYVAAKHGVQGCLESVKEDIRALGHTNIQFTTVFPHYVSTPLVSNISFESKYPFLMPKLDPEEAAVNIIDGVRMGRENIYLPLTSFISILYKSLVLPSVFRKTLDTLEYDVISLGGEHSTYPTFH